MNKKKKIIQLTEGILLCCVIVVMTLSLHRDHKKRGKEYKRKINRDNWVVSNTR